MSPLKVEECTLFLVFSLTELMTKTWSVLGYVRHSLRMRLESRKALHISLGLSMSYSGEAGRSDKNSPPRFAPGSQRAPKLATDYDDSAFFGTAAALMRAWLHSIKLASPNKSSRMGVSRRSPLKALQWEALACSRGESCRAHPGFLPNPCLPTPLQEKVRLECFLQLLLLLLVHQKNNEPLLDRLLLR